MTALKPCPACSHSETWRHWHTMQVHCKKCDFSALSNTWNAIPRPADIVAARIEGLREALVIIKKSKREDGRNEAVADVNARIAELGATAPEVSEMRAKAEAFDAAYKRFEDSNSDNVWWFLEQMDIALAEAKRERRLPRPTRAGEMPLALGPVGGGS